MWPFNYRKVTERLNTVDLGDDLDDVEMLMAVEEIFQIKLQDSETVDLVSVGELCELVKGKMPRDGSVDPVWKLIVLIVKSHSGSLSPIDAETTFFPKFAKPRQK